jgi:hypothetical protein
LLTTKYIIDKSKSPYIYEYWLDLFIKEELADLKSELDSIFYKLKFELNSIVYNLKPKLDKHIIANYNILKNLPAGKIININNKSYVKLAVNKHYYIDNHFLEINTSKIIHYSNLAEMYNEIIKT